MLDRSRLPDAATFFDSEGLKLTGPGRWKTTRCVFHDGSDSMRVNTATGGWCCMSCGAKGGDPISYLMQAQGLEFVDACRALGAWVDDGRPQAPQKPAPLPPRQALQVIAFEATLAATAAGNMARGVVLSDTDRVRLMTAAGRISLIVEAYE